MDISKNTTKITKILHQKFGDGNLTISADRESIGNKKVYGNIPGIIFGFPHVIAAGWLYHTPVSMLLYLLSCYDDFSEIVAKLAGYKKVFGLGF